MQRTLILLSIAAIGVILAGCGSGRLSPKASFVPPAQVNSSNIPSAWQFRYGQYLTLGTIAGQYCRGAVTTAQRHRYNTLANLYHFAWPDQERLIAVPRPKQLPTQPPSFNRMRAAICTNS